MRHQRLGRLTWLLQLNAVLGCYRWGGEDFPMGIRLLSLCFNEVTVMTGCGRRFTAARIYLWGITGGQWDA